VKNQVFSFGQLSLGSILDLIQFKSIYDSID